MLIHETLEQSARIYGEKPALIYRGESVTYRRLNECADSIAHGLLRYGIDRQDRVIIYLPNSIEVVIALYAILKANAIFVIINPQVKSNKLSYIINDCGAKAIITDKDGFSTVLVNHDVCPSLSVIVLTDNQIPIAKIPNKKILTYTELLNESHHSLINRTTIDIDLASLIYTSGSTGEPKGVMLTHLNMITAARSIIKYLENDENDIIINVLPLSFDYGLYQVLMSIFFGGTVILEKSFVYPTTVLELMKKHRVTGFPLVPTITSLLLTMRNLKGEEFPDLRYITNTGQALPISHIHHLRKLFPKVKIFSMYGLTECKRVSYLPPEEIDRRPNSVGKAIPNTEVYIIDEEDNVIDVPYKPGQLVVRGAHVMAGYWGQPDKTEMRLKSGKYPGERILYTGDVFEQDEDGFLYFLGRQDDMFKSGGQFVSPKEVENVLLSCPGIFEAAVVGVDDDILGQAVAAFLVMEEGSIMSTAQIIEYCSTRLERHMVPKFIMFPDNLPHNANGKIDKNVLRESMIK